MKTRHTARRRETLQVRLTRAEHDLFESQARKSGLSLSAWVRMCCLSLVRQDGAQ